MTPFLCYKSSYSFIISTILPEPLPPSWEAELSREDRIELAYIAWLEAGGIGNRILSIIKVVKQYRILKSILVDRINSS